MAADYSMLTIVNQQIQNLYKQVKGLSCNNTTEILKTGAMVDKMLMQYRDNVELLILQAHLEILNSANNGRAPLPRGYGNWAETFRCCLKKCIWTT